MADRYQDRPYPSDDYGRGGGQHGGTESDPLAELARLIGQTDPFAMQSRPNTRPAAQNQGRDSQGYDEQGYEDQGYDDQGYVEPAPPAGPPSWVRRANVTPQPGPQEEYQPVVSPVHPLHRYGAAQPAPEPEPEPDYHPVQSYQQAYREPEPQPADLARYDDALYGAIQAGEHDFQREAAYPDDPYAYQGDYADEDVDEERPRKRGMMTVAAILALAVVGTGGAFAYKTYLGSPRSGEPPIIKADNSPTKVVPAPTDGSTKLPDRVAAGDGTEKIVPREEAPVDVNAKAGGPRVVFPPLNPNANPPSVSSVSPSAIPPQQGTAPSNGTMPNSEPRKIRTLAVKGDQTDSTAPQVAAPATTAPKPGAAKAAAPVSHNPPTSANASVANQPMSLAPQGGSPEPAGQQMAATTPTQIAPSAASSAGGGFIVQVSSQKNESDAQASYRVLQGKYGNLLGSRPPVVKRVDLSDKGKGIVYRAFAGPYGSQEEASKVCNSLKSAGLSDCFIHRN